MANGFTAHKGEKLNLTCRSALLNDGRGLQGDQGHLGVIVRGGEFGWNTNDGGGGESGIWLWYGSYIHDNGGNVDSRDGLQITNPEYYEIIGNKIGGHHNANIILNRLTRGGLVWRNYCYKARHGLAIELLGSYPKGLIIEKNIFEDVEYGIFFFGQKPKNFDAKKLNEANEFRNCEHKVFERWDK